MWLWRWRLTASGQNLEDYLWSNRLNATVSHVHMQTMLLIVLQYSTTVYLVCLSLPMHAISEVLSWFQVLLSLLFAPKQIKWIHKSLCLLTGQIDIHEVKLNSCYAVMIQRSLNLLRWLFETTSCTHCLLPQMYLVNGTQATKWRIHRNLKDCTWFL